MSKNKKIGDWGEKLAVSYLQDKGYIVVEKNYRYSRLEIDLIVKKGKLLVFVEVKTRSGTRFGHPEEWVDQQKMDHMFEASEQYIHETDWQGEIRFDVIAILKQEPPEIKHFIDSFG